MQDILYQTFRWVGILAPLFLFLATLVVLYGKTTLTAFFVVGAALNVALNFALKYGFQQARPGQEEQLRIDLAAGKTVALDRYGMPSGHAQEMAFNVVFLALAYYNSLLKKEYYTLAVAIALTVVSVVQRAWFHQHTVWQLAAGLAIGSATGFLCYLGAAHLLRGPLATKRDDFAFAF